MPFTATISDLSAMPVRRARPVNDEISVGLLEGRVREETEGVDFAVGRVDQRREMFRGRARRRGVKQVSRSQLDEQGRVILLVWWCREQPGDLRVREQPRRRRREARRG